MKKNDKNKMNKEKWKDIQESIYFLAIGAVLGTGICGISGDTNIVAIVITIILVLISIIVNSITITEDDDK